MEEKIEQEKNRKVFLDELIYKEKDLFNSNINWMESCKQHKNIKFIYDKITGIIELIDYDKTKQKLTIKYNNKIDYILTDSIKKCRIGKIIGQHTSDFKIEIGTIFKDDKREITIIDRKVEKRRHGKSIVNEKYYKYKCSKCGFDCGKHWSLKDKEYKDEYWITENSIKQGGGCIYCSNNAQIVIKGINDIATTHPYLVKYFKNVEDAYTHTFSSGEKVLLKCPDCGFEKMIAISVLYNYGFSCSKCGDKIPYTEKLIFNILNYILSKDFEYQYIITNRNYIYDFYFKYKDEQYICEVNGIQHYQDAWYKFEKTQENDKIKKKLALSNGIKEENYIVIDCRKSELDWIKEHVLESKLNELFDLSKVNWNKCHEFACKTLVKEVCDYWNCKNINETTTDLIKTLKLNRVTIIKYLKQGNILGWCNYSAKNEIGKNNINIGKIGKILGCKRIEVFNKEGLSLGIFPSAKELERQSEKLFGVKLQHSNIAYVCLGKRKTHKKLKFKYVC